MRFTRIIFALAISVTACAAPQYDDQTDKLISQLQTDLDTQIVTLITLDHKIAALSGKTDAVSRKALAAARTAAEYEANAAFYDRLDVELAGLRTRVDAEPSLATPALDGALKNLRDNLLAAAGSMQATHQKVNILSEPYLVGVRTLVDAQIGALLTRELGLRNSTSAFGASK